MKFAKEVFLKSEFGTEMMNCIERWDRCISNGDNVSAAICTAQWLVYERALKQFCDLNCNLSRAKDYYGIISIDAEHKVDWLMKVERKA